jgi:hypothetical protein
MNTEFPVLNLGVIEVANLSSLGKMSYNRANKIRKEQFGGRPWRFISASEFGYIRKLHLGLGLGLGGLPPSFYWSSSAFGVSEALALNLVTGFPWHTRKSSADCFVLLVREVS